MTLTEFLEARLADDERTANAVTTEQWDGEAAHYEFNDLDDQAFDHVRRHDPARVLREVAAKRAILTLLASAGVEDVNVGIELEIQRHMAAVYSGHPDYDPAWAPEGAR